MSKSRLLKISLVVLLASTVSARLNPFEPTKTYEEEKQGFQRVSKKPLPNADDGTRTVKIIAQDKPTKKVVEKTTLPVPTAEDKKVKQEIVPEPIIEKKIVKSVEDKIIEEDIPPPVKKEIIEEKKEEVVKKVVETPKPKKETLKSLPFVQVDIIDEVLTIKVRDKYKLKKRFTLKDENKFVFDFNGKVRFYTKRDDTKVSEEFKKVTIGNHPKYSYFRVVVKTKDNIKNYKVQIDKKGLISISKN